MRESKEDDAFDVYLRFKEYSEIPWPEHRVDKWSRMFHETLGFEWIMPKPSPGDYLGLKDGTEVIIELESTTSGFFLHKSEIRDRIDVIVCFSIPISNKELKEIKEKTVIEIKPYVKYLTDEISQYCKEIDTYFALQKMSESFKRPFSRIW